MEKLLFAVLLFHSVGGHTDGKTSYVEEDAIHPTSSDSGKWLPNPYADFPDYPIQLVRPDPLHHRELEVVEANVKYLHHIHSAVAIVAVVGKYHSGKSFLLNQLMRKQHGFGIGPTVRPETMGIWMWGKPLDIELSSGKSVSLIFIDTEGFAANNISETYDAKVFSVATLLSSYLIYNSVKIIDQSEIDYLELLARRTQLFALRSQMSRSQWFDEFNHDLLKFPPFVWVVQDFVQVTEGDESPREWLHKIMESSTRESVEHDINLIGMFEKVDCHTLFLPATTKRLLQDLSKATEEDLTPEYKQERDNLLKLLKKGLTPKEKNGKPISGPELATLLEILVTAANQGSLAEIPGRWDVFLKELSVSALEDCVTFYESDMMMMNQKSKLDAINETDLKLWHLSAALNADKLLTQLLFGLESSILESTGELSKILMEKFEKTAELNVKKIHLKCSDMQRHIEIMSEERIQSVELPMKTTKLLEMQKEITESALLDYATEVHYLSDNPAYNKNFKRLKDGLSHIMDTISLRNNAAFVKHMKRAVNLAVEKFQESSVNTNQIPRKTDMMASIIRTAVADARKTFQASTEFCRDESSHQVYEAFLETKLQDETENCKLRNLELIRVACEAEVKDLVHQFHHSTSASKLVLPLNDTALEARLAKERNNIFEDYQQRMFAFEDTSAFLETRVHLSLHETMKKKNSKLHIHICQLEKLDLECAQRKEENYQAYIREVETPLKTAQKLIKLSAERYDTEFSVRQYMITVCLLNLNEGKAKDWDASLKLKIAEKYIDSSPELVRIIASKKGLWSTLKGFFQWIFHFFPSL